MGEGEGAFRWTVLEKNTTFAVLKKHKTYPLVLLVKIGLR